MACATFGDLRSVTRPRMSPIRFRKTQVFLRVVTMSPIETSFSGRGRHMDGVIEAWKDATVAMRDMAHRAYSARHSE